MSKKQASELTASELNDIAHFYMLEFMEQGVRPSDRDGSQKHQARLWYAAVTKFLGREALNNAKNDTDKRD